MRKFFSWIALLSVLFSVMSFQWLYAIGPVVNFDANGISDCPFPNWNGATGAGTCGGGYIAPHGSGKYREDIYWLDWGRWKGQNLQNGDYSLFKTPSGTIYKITIQDLNQLSWSYWLKALNSDDWGGNNFPYAYRWHPTITHNAPNTPIISLRTRHNGMEFKVIVEVFEQAADGSLDKVSDYGNIVVAGTESLYNNQERYSLEASMDWYDTIIGGQTVHKDPQLGVIESYINGNNFSNLQTKAIVSEKNEAKPSDGGVSHLYRKMVVENSWVWDSRWDLMVAALGVHEIYASVSTERGGQHFAIWLVDFVDWWDLPLSYEGPLDVSGMQHPASHLSTPVLKGWMVSVGTATSPENNYFIWSLGKNEFTSPSWASIGKEIWTLKRPDLVLGSILDFEKDSNPTNDAMGDDTDNLDDEDGASTIITWCSGSVSVSKDILDTAYLHYWLDWNENGQFDANEYHSTFVSHTGTEVAYFPLDGLYDQNVLKSTPEVDTRFMRFRLSLNQNLEYYGLDSDGEVEDNRVSFLYPRVKTGSLQNSCSDPTAPVEFIDLPETGWKITGSGFIAQDCIDVWWNFNSGKCEVSGNSTGKTLNLPVGSYDFEIGSFDGIAPENCKITLDETVEVQNGCDPGIQLEKTHEALIDTNGDGVVWGSGDSVTYVFNVTNTGNVDLHDISISDPLPNLGTISPAIIPLLPVDGTGSFQASYTVTQADIDAGTIENTAVASAKDLKAVQYNWKNWELRMTRTTMEQEERKMKPSRIPLRLPTLVLSPSQVSPLPTRNLDLQRLLVLTRWLQEKPRPVRLLEATPSPKQTSILRILQTLLIRMTREEMMIQPSPLSLKAVQYNWKKPINLLRIQMEMVLYDQSEIKLSMYLL